MTKWSLTRAAAEFGVARATLTARLRETGYKISDTHDVSKAQSWTVRQCHDALRGSGDRDAVKYRAEAAAAELAELEVAKARRNLVSVEEVVGLFDRILAPFRARLLAAPAVLGQAANPSDPVHGTAEVGRWVDSVLPLLRQDLVDAFATGNEVTTDDKEIDS